MLETRVISAQLVPPTGDPVTLTPRPQQNLTALADGFSRIVPADSAGLDDPAVLGFVLPANTPARSELIIELECRPAPEVAAAMDSLAGHSPGFTVR
jgi:hypothetical protein